jgi:hypothetical protein
MLMLLPLPENLAKAAKQLLCPTRLKLRFRFPKYVASEYHNVSLWSLAQCLSLKAIRNGIYADNPASHVDRFRTHLNEFALRSSAYVSQIKSQALEDYRRILTSPLWKTQFKTDLIEFTDTRKFWEFVEAQKNAFQHQKLVELARAVLNVPPVVTSVDTFFSVVGCLTDKHRLTTHDHVISQAFLHANGDWRQRYSNFPWYFCDGRPDRIRTKIIEEKQQQQQQQQTS